jgi:hypothetical protein
VERVQRSAGSNHEQGWVAGPRDFCRTLGLHDAENPSSDRIADIDLSASCSKRQPRPRPLPREDYRLEMGGRLPAVLLICGLWVRFPPGSPRFLQSEAKRLD